MFCVELRKLVLRFQGEEDISFFVFILDFP